MKKNKENILKNQVNNNTDVKNDQQKVINDIQDARYKTYLRFSVGNETYALLISLVREYFFMHDVYTIPLVPKYIKGVINLRGNIIPILDMSLLFYNIETEFQDEANIIVVEIEDEGENVIVGMLVDEVYEVMKIKDSDIKNIPDFSVKIDSKYIAGIVNEEDNYLVVLDREQLFNIDRLAEYSVKGIA